jgi:hypothetical protein
LGVSLCERRVMPIQIMIDQENTVPAGIGE